MTDIFSAEKRSEIMRKVKGWDTKPELAIRRILHKLGYRRYSLHKKDLPGCPDIVLNSRKKVIFIHGCFWHSHNCRPNVVPKSNVGFWKKKLEGNKKRDRQAKYNLTKMGYSYKTVWECEIRKDKNLERKIEEFLRKNDQA